MPIINGTLEKRDQICSQLFNLCLTPNENFKFDPGFVQIFDLLERLIAIESDVTFCGTTRRDAAGFKDFEKFLNEHGCNTEDQFSIENFESSGYGVKSKQTFEKGEVLFRVPKSVILTLEEANGTELAELIKKDKLLNAMPNVSLALLLLYLKTTTIANNNNNNNTPLSKKFQKWHPYLDILPSEFNTPLYFSLDEIKMLQSSHCFNDVLLHFRSIARQYAYLVGVLRTQSGLHELKENFSYENYRWCVSAVSTRQNQIVDRMKRPVLAMIPLLDMCNHDPENDQFSTDFDDEKQAAVCLAAKNIAQGDEVKIFYGRRTNSEMLIHNGFVPETNKFDSFKLKLGLSPHDSLIKLKSSVLQTFGLNSSDHFVLRPDEIPADVLFFVKVLISKTEADLKSIESFEPKDPLAYVQSTDLSVNQDVIKFLNMRLGLLLSSLEKQQKQFVNQTSDENHSINRLFIRRLIDGEISVLKCLVQVFKI